MLYQISLFQVAEGLAGPTGLSKQQIAMGLGDKASQSKAGLPKAGTPLTPGLQQRNGAYNNSLVSFPVLLILRVGVETAMSTHMSSCAFGGQRCQITLELTL